MGKGRYKLYRCEESYHDVEKGSYVLFDTKRWTAYAYKQLGSVLEYFGKDRMDELSSISEFLTDDIPEPRFRLKDQVVFSRPPFPIVYGTVQERIFDQSGWKYMIREVEENKEVWLTESLLDYEHYFFIDTKGTVRKANRGYDLTADDYRRRMFNMFSTEMDAQDARIKMMNFLAELDKKYNLKIRLKSV